MFPQDAPHQHTKFGADVLPHDPVDIYVVADRGYQLYGYGPQHVSVSAWVYPVLREVDPSMEVVKVTPGANISQSGENPEPNILEQDSGA